MDANRFDDWSRSLAQRLTRRRALGVASVSGISVATTVPRSASAQPGSQTCVLTLRAAVGGGPSAGTTFDGTLEFTFGADGTITSGTFSSNTGASAEVSGSAIGRALDLVMTLADRRELSITGTIAAPVEQCAGPAAGVISGPEAGDIGAWQA